MAHLYSFETTKHRPNRDPIDRVHFCFWKKNIYTHDQFYHHLNRIHENNVFFCCRTNYSLKQTCAFILCKQTDIRGSKETKRKKNTSTIDTIESDKKLNEEWSERMIDGTTQLNINLAKETRENNESRYIIIIIRNKTIRVFIRLSSHQTKINSIAVWVSNFFLY